MWNGLGVTVAWGLSVLRRVTDEHLRNLLLSIAGFFLLFLLLQVINYIFAQRQPWLRRYAWYGYYVCMIAFAIIMYELSFSLSQDEGKRSGAVRFLLPASGIVLAVGVLTNDLHQLAFRFKTAEMLPGSPKSYGPLFYLYFACFFLLLLFASALIMKKYRQFIRRDSFFTLLPILALAVFLVLNMFDLTPRIGGIKMWQLGELFTFCMLAFLEICIITHLIPANTDYEKLFALSTLPAVILDEEGVACYSSLESQHPFPDSENTMVMRHPISGGCVEWAVDIAPLNALNQELSETTQRINSRNAYLSEEAKIKKEKAEVESRNRIYDEITRIVRPQLQQINTLLKMPGRSFDEQLPSIAVCCVYIKRRSNMELLADNGTLPFEELSLAVKESLAYVRLLGVNAASYASGTGIYPAVMVIAAYERVESVLEDCLETISDLMIRTKAEPGAITVRMMLKTDALTLPVMEKERATVAYHESVSVTKDGKDMILIFTFREGGKKHE